MRERYAQNPKPKLDYCRNYYALDPSKSSLKMKKWYEKNRVKANLRNRKWASILKSEVLTHYGKNGTLMCCWKDCEVSDIDMLTIDHVNNDGAHDRKTTGRKTSTLYIRLRRTGFPSGFQTLCANHQFKKELLRKRAGSMHSDQQIIALDLCQPKLKLNP